MHQFTPFKRGLLNTAVLSALTCSSFATIADESTAQPKLEVIEVSAQKVVQNIQDVPISVTALNGDMLADNGIKDLNEMSVRVPNLTIADSAINTNIFIRGVGSGNNRAFEQSVGMFIDGIYMGRDRQYRVPFLDVERAEVLRGPQGILFGKNTIAGTLNITTAKATPGAELSGMVSAEWEPEYNGRSLTGVLDKGLSDELGVRFAFKEGRSDGFMHNTLLNRDEPALDDSLYRLSVNWQPNSDFEVNFKAEKSSFSVLGSTLQITGMTPLDPVSQFIAGVVLPALDPNFETQRNLERSSDNKLVPEGRDTDATNFAMTADWQLDAGTLTFVSGYSAYDSMEHLDGDAGPMAFITTSEDHDFDQYSQEIRFASNQSSRFSYITGLYYQQSDLHIDYWSNARIDDFAPVLASAMQSLPATMLNPAAPAGATIWDLGIRPESLARSTLFDQQSKTYSAFFQGTWHINDDLRMILGGRYSKETKDAVRATKLTEPGSTYYDTATQADMNSIVTGALMKITLPLPYFEGSRTENNFTPSVKFQYDVSDDVMVYVNAEKGFKGGGFNAAPDATLENQEFQQEEATGFELGMKSDLLDGRARLNAAFFHTTFDNLQVTTWNGYAFEVGNAAKSTTQGIELDGQYLLTDNLTLTASGSWLDSTYDSYAAGPCTVLVTVSEGTSQCDLSGQKTPYAADWSANITLDYYYELEDYEINASLNANYTDDYYVDTDLDESLKQKAVTTFNARISFAPFSGDWELALVGKNLSDERIITAGIDTPLVAGGFAAYTAPPRTISLQASVHF